MLALLLTYEKNKKNVVDVSDDEFDDWQHKLRGLNLPDVKVI